MNMNETMIRARHLSKIFTMHNQGGIALPVLDDVDLQVGRSEAVVLHGPSGAGKSTLLRILYGNYRPSAGAVEIRHEGQLIDIVAAHPRLVIAIRKKTLSYVSQFLRVIPRVTTLDIVKDPMLSRGVSDDEADRRAKTMLARLNLPERLWSLPPQTFSGGEQQRVNIARSFVDPTPIMLLDEPTASLDAGNRAIVVELIADARMRGSAIVGIFHDEGVRDAVATRVFPVQVYREAA
jgi:alpha-D-ribose 1-methylphosphonate 5-triphosphate synthase subunit PhnL